MSVVREGGAMPSEPALLNASGRTYMLYPGACGSHGRSSRSSACEAARMRGVDQNLHVATARNMHVGLLRWRSDL